MYASGEAVDWTRLERVNGLLVYDLYLHIHSVGFCSSSLGVLNGDATYV